MPKKKKDLDPIIRELATPDIVPGESLTQERPLWRGVGATKDASARRDKMAKRIADKMGLTDNPDSSKEASIEKILPALAALARGAAGGAIRSGIASAASGGGGDDSDSPIQQSVKKIHKAEPELHPDVNDAMKRLGTLPTRSKS